MKAVRRSLARLLAAVAATSASAVEAPLEVRNLSPAAQIFGVPHAAGADVLAAGYELAFTADVANHFTSDIEGSNAAFFDGETTVLAWRYRRAFASAGGDRFELGVEIPYLFHDGGFLDAGIENFHDVFGFDDNGRDLAQRNQIDYLIRIDDETFVDLQDQREGFADVRATVGYQLTRGDSSAWALRALVELPTGEAEQLTGSEAIDVALWVEHGRSALFGFDRASLSAAVGAVWLGEGDVAPERQEDFAGYGHVGLAWRLADAISLLGQLDYHTRLIDTGLDQVADAALQGTLGARFRYKDRLTTDFAFVEDLTSDSTADVAFQLRLAAWLD